MKRLTAAAALNRTAVRPERTAPHEPAASRRQRQACTGVLEICPYEPPRSGWVTRVKLLRHLIQAQGVTCDVLDVGPNRRVERPGCLPTHGPVDYLRKIVRFARLRFTFHGHVNAEYLRGVQLACLAFLVGRAFGNRCVLTYHGGLEQRFFTRRHARIERLSLRLTFALSDAIVCNSEAIAAGLSRYADRRRIKAIPAFSTQYLDYSPTPLSRSLELFLEKRRPLLSTYVCYRDGFHLETLLGAVEALVAAWPTIGLVMVGTGPRRTAVSDAVERKGIGAHVFFAGDLSHDEFMTLLTRSHVHLRTPVTDGVSATVLEALSLGVVVVASDNGARPPGVVTYEADSPDALATAVSSVLHDLDRLRALIAPPVTADTAAAEVQLLLDGSDPS
jgi:glycosyltransferase involved in cell wall biosynthesis